MKDQAAFSDDFELDLIGERLERVEQRGTAVLQSLGLERSLFLLGSKELESWHQETDDRDQLKAREVSTLLALVNMVRVQLDSGKYLGALRHCAEALATSDLLLDAELGFHQRIISSKRGGAPKQREGIWTAIVFHLMRFRRAGQELPTGRRLWKWFEQEYSSTRPFQCDSGDRSYWVYREGDRINQVRLDDQRESSIGFSAFQKYYSEAKSKAKSER